MASARACCLRWARRSAHPWRRLGRRGHDDDGRWRRAGDGGVGTRPEQQEPGSQRHDDGEADDRADDGGRWRLAPAGGSSGTRGRPRATPRATLAVPSVNGTPAPGSGGDGATARSHQTLRAHGSSGKPASAPGAAAVGISEDPRAAWRHWAGQTRRHRASPLGLALGGSRPRRSARRRRAPPAFQRGVDDGS